MSKGSMYDSTIGELTGSNRAADAAQSAAQAQERAQSVGVQFATQGLSDARDVSQRMNRDIDSAIADASSPQELRALMGSLQQQESALDRQAELFRSIDPAIMEASQQALSILRGEDSAQSTGIAKRRAGERDKLVSRLREQLGPGAETSTAGIQALSKFDSETEELQQNSLGQLFGMAQAGAQGRGALNQSTANLANIGGAFGNRGGRLAQTQLQGAGMRANAGGLVQNAQNARINAQQGLAAASGSQFVGEQLRGQAQNQFVNDRIQAGEQMASQAMGSAGSACCFIFLEARYGNGTMDSVVRKFRDELMTPRNRRGYYKLSEVLVPLMRKYPSVKWLVRTFMTSPMVAAGNNLYGKNKWGWIFKPVAHFWIGLFDFLGQDHPFIRENGEVV